MAQVITHPSVHLRRIETLAKLMDNQFKIANFRFGLDPILGLIPGVGDAVTLLVSFYIFYVAYAYGVPRWQLGIMLKNIGIDYLVGLIPFVGDIGDFFVKANTKNLQILKKYLE